MNEILKHIISDAEVTIEDIVTDNPEWFKELVPWNDDMLNNLRSAYEPVKTNEEAETKFPILIYMKYIGTIIKPDDAIEHIKGLYNLYISFGLLDNTIRKKSNDALLIVYKRYLRVKELDESEKAIEEIDKEDDLYDELNVNMDTIKIARRDDSSEIINFRKALSTLKDEFGHLGRKKPVTKEEVFWDYINNPNSTPVSLDALSIKYIKRIAEEVTSDGVKVFSKLKPVPGFINAGTNKPDRTAKAVYDKVGGKLSNDIEIIINKLNTINGIITGDTFYNYRPETRKQMNLVDPYTTYKDIDPGVIRAFASDIATEICILVANLTNFKTILQGEQNETK